MSSERQVLFRLDEKLLKRLDREIQRRGFKTRNAWFRSIVQDEITNGKKA